MIKMIWQDLCLTILKVKVLSTMALHMTVMKILKMKNKILTLVLIKLILFNIEIDYLMINLNLMEFKLLSIFHLAQYTLNPMMNFNKCLMLVMQLKLLKLKQFLIIKNNIKIKVSLLSLMKKNLKMLWVVLKH